MTVTELRPNSSDGTATIVFGSTYHCCVSDDADSTYIHTITGVDGVWESGMEFGFDSHTLASGEIVKSLAYSVRQDIVVGASAYATVTSTFAHTPVYIQQQVPGTGNLVTAVGLPVAVNFTQGGLSTRVSM